MAELIDQILKLPQAEKWQIFSILAEALRKESESENNQIPQWQIDLALQAKKDLETGKVKAMSHESFWAAIDAKVEQLENKAGK